MKEPESIPANGTKLRVVNLWTDESYLKAMFVPEYRKAMRRAGEVVEMAGYVAGHGGDVWWCRHANGDVAPYGWAELEYEPNAALTGSEAVVPSNGWLDSCDYCASQEDGGHYCLLHSRQMQNMNTLRCSDWTPKPEPKKSNAEREVRT